AQVQVECAGGDEPDDDLDLRIGGARWAVIVRSATSSRRCQLGGRRCRVGPAGCWPGSGARCGHRVAGGARPLTTRCLWAVLGPALLLAHPSRAPERRPQPPRGCGSLAAATAASLLPGRAG